VHDLPAIQLDDDRLWPARRGFHGRTQDLLHDPLLGEIEDDLAAMRLNYPRRTDGPRHDQAVLGALAPAAALAPDFTDDGIGR